MEQLAQSDTALEQARIAADNSDWEGYQIAMGGIHIHRADRPISMVYWHEVDTNTGEMPLNQYGEIKAESVFGVEFDGMTINTRPHKWQLYKAI
jgi:hypothetical protein